MLSSFILDIFSISRQPQHIKKTKLPEILLMQGCHSKVKLDNLLFCFKCVNKDCALPSYWETT